MAFIDAPKELMYNQIAVMSTDGTGARFVPTLGIIVNAVAISPDGSRIAFQGEANNNDDIFIVNTDGSGLQQLTNDPATDQFPAWSPDGTTIVYDNAGRHEQVSDPQFSKTAEIYSVSADGGVPARITHNKGYDAAPSFSPNGKTIVDESFQGITMMRANGTDYHRFVNMGGFTPRYSPNGKTVAFTNFTGRWRPDVQLGGNYSPSSALCYLATADVKTGDVTKLANVGMATDYNTPQWMDNQHILVMRVQAHPPA
jgi:TolB protein